MAQVFANVYATHTPINLSRIRNGALADITRTSRVSSIPEKYHFNGIRYFADLDGNAATRRVPCPPTVLFEAQFRSAFSNIVECNVAAEAAAVQRNAVPGNAAGNQAAQGGAAANAGAQVNANQGVAAQGAGAAAGQAPAGNAGQAAFDEDAVRARERALLVNRLEAIAIGAVRTTLVLSYTVSEADIRVTERKNALLRVVAPAAAADEQAFANRMSSITRDWVIELAANVRNHERDNMAYAANLSAVEAELAFSIMAIGLASPVRAGIQLMLDGHHYHSNASDSSRHRTIEKEVLSKMTQPAIDLWKANEQMFRNAIWHASIHPVVDEVLEAFAQDLEVAAKLTKAGYGSMAVGIPAKEELVRRAEAFIAVYTQVRMTAQAHGHVLDISALENRLAALTRLPMRGPLLGNAPAELGLPNDAWPAEIDTRAKAIKTYLEPVLNRNEPIASWMFGFYRAICDDAGIRRTTTEGSLLRSYSLNRAMQNFIGEANRAQTMYAARQKFLRAQAADGHLELYTGTFTV